MEPDELQFVNFLNDWDDCPKSFGNGFTEHMDGEPNHFALDRTFSPSKTSGKSASHTSTESRERVEASGRNIGTIVGLSKKSKKTQQDAKRYHVTVSQGA